MEDADYDGLHHPRICGELTVCDQCLGTTVNGGYDVSTLQKTATDCNATFCAKCKIDNRDATGICRKCHNTIAKGKPKKYEKNILHTIRGEHLKAEQKLLQQCLRDVNMPKEIISIIDEYFNEYSQMKCDYWYMVDDCLSCS
jgi:hypothetical protein